MYLALDLLDNCASSICTRKVHVGVRAIMEGGAIAYYTNLVRQSGRSGRGTS
jgi:hypothetical protein